VAVKKNPDSNNISRCDQCPNFRTRLFGPSYCGTEGRILESTPMDLVSWNAGGFIIPQWCPLEDVVMTIPTVRGKP
jgi:hypothetical protein